MKIIKSITDLGGHSLNINDRIEFNINGDIYTGEVSRHGTRKTIYLHIFDDLVNIFIQKLFGNDEPQTHFRKFLKETIDYHPKEGLWPETDNLKSLTIAIIRIFELIESKTLKQKEKMEPRVFHSTRELNGHQLNIGDKIAFHLPFDNVIIGEVSYNKYGFFITEHLNEQFRDLLGKSLYDYVKMIPNYGPGSGDWPETSNLETLWLAVSSIMSDLERLPIKVDSHKPTLKATLAENHSLSAGVYSPEKHKTETPIKTGGIFIKSKSQLAVNKNFIKEKLRKAHSI